MDTHTHRASRYINVAALLMVAYALLVLWGGHALQQQLGPEAEVSLVRPGLRLFFVVGIAYYLIKRERTAWWLALLANVPGLIRGVTGAAVVLTGMAPPPHPGWWVAPPLLIVAEVLLLLPATRQAFRSDAA